MPSDLSEHRFLLGELCPWGLNIDPHKLQESRTSDGVCHKRRRELLLIWSDHSKVGELRVTRVRIRAPARLHWALLNLSGLLNRVDGGIGLMIDEPAWEIEAGLDQAGIHGVPLEDDHLAGIQQVLAKLPSGISRQLGIRIVSSIPAHAGLGSKTSLLLAVGRAASLLSGQADSPLNIARLLSRGGTSGIGVNGYSAGGLIWDVGRKYPAEKSHFGPSSLSHCPPPRAIRLSSLDWLSVVHFRFDRTGLSGSDEADFFSRTCPLPTIETERLAICTSLQLIPAILDEDEEELQDGIRSIQELGL
ncbi:MAG TPA: beta-ribofuranosylaminobenzene 5'-phosphate synthase family protein, partial [Myxococcaceae bacterium]|nr:beta-ribofuranosylaminobenzene 5'-phosphate synthase family protein [Myxococcaceae bacterium]